MNSGSARGRGIPGRVGVEGAVRRGLGGGCRHPASLCPVVERRTSQGRPIVVECRAGLGGEIAIRTEPHSSCRIGSESRGRKGHETARKKWWINTRVRAVDDRQPAGEVDIRERQVGYGRGRALRRRSCGACDRAARGLRASHQKKRQNDPAAHPLVQTRAARERFRGLS